MEQELGRLMAEVADVQERARGACAVLKQQRLERRFWRELQWAAWALFLVSGFALPFAIGAGNGYVLALAATALCSTFALHRVCARRTRFAAREIDRLAGVVQEARDRELQLARESLAKGQWGIAMATATAEPELTDAGRAIVASAGLTVYTAPNDGPA